MTEKTNWEIIEYLPKHKVKAQCKMCGNIYIVDKYNILNRKSTKCFKCAANLKSETTNFKTHGLSKKYKKLYNVWSGIKRRCYNKNQKSFKNYGGRGIIMCDEWKNDFSKFHKWAFENGYKEGLEIDRINNNGNYEPSNCRWITKQENISRRIYIPTIKTKWKETITKTGKTEEELDDIIEAATSGYFKSIELSALTGLERHTITKLVKRCDLKPVWRKTKLEVFEIKKIRNIYKDNSYKSNERFCIEMAKQFNSNRETIREIIKEVE